MCVVGGDAVSALHQSVAHASLRLAIRRVAPGPPGALHRRMSKSVSKAISEGEDMDDSDIGGGTTLVILAASHPPGPAREATRPGPGPGPGLGRSSGSPLGWPVYCHPL